MTKFLINFTKFLIPFVILLIALELYVVYFPSTFNKKANYLQRHKDDIEVLVLGSSHNQNAINPEWMQLNCLNLANASQDIQLDEALFFRYATQLKKLKLVIFELDYFSLEEKNDATNFRLPWYKRFFDIEPYPISLLHKISIYSSQPSFFNKLLIDAANPRKTTYKLNQYGFITNDFPGVMEDLNYDTAKLLESAGERLHQKHTDTSLYNLNFNKTKLNTMLNYCVEKNIKILILSSPMYSTYVHNELAVKKERKQFYTDSLQKANTAFKYYNYETDGRFKVNDFKNDDHLNSAGAEKYSKIVDSLVKTALSSR
ncbi:MAG TPA: hypothetical protein PK504_11235 [Ferruginibacter sp.]|nr:hypothetical protein [Ferruginibacter sp.]